jgi:hypothetical protein
MTLADPEPTAMRPILAVLAAAALLAGCATSSTNFVNTRKAPDAAPVSFAGKKVAAFALGVTEPMRRDTEEALARELSARGAQGVPAYQLVPSTELRDREAAKVKLRQAGVEGVVLLRLVDTQKKKVHTEWATHEYSTLSHYYTWGIAGADPGYDRTVTTLSVETLIYSLVQDRLLWSGLSETTNAAQAERFVREHAAAVAAELRREGLIR